MEDYFGKFGPIKTCKIICKHDTQVSRGFGFVIYATREAAEKVIQYRDDHYINGKWVDCKSAILRQEMQPPVNLSKKNQPKKKKKKVTTDGSSPRTGKNSESNKNSKSYNNSGSGSNSQHQKGYNYSYEDNSHPPANYYGYSSEYYKHQDYLPDDHNYDHYYKHLQSYNSYQYHKNLDHYGYGRNPYEYQSQSQVRPQASEPKKKFGEAENQHMIPREQKVGDSQKQPGQPKRGFNRTPQTQLPVSNNLHSEEVSTTKTNQKISPIVNDEDPSQQMTTEQYYPDRAFIPLIEEEDHDGYDDPYSIANHNNQHQLANQGFPNLGQMQKGDSPSNYKPFGTHFGPRILNRYGGHADFLTPQAKHVMSHQYVNLPGDSSSKSSPFQKNGQPVPKTQPVISLGFSSLAEQVVKRKVNNQRETQDNPDLN